MKKTGILLPTRSYKTLADVRDTAFNVTIVSLVGIEASGKAVNITSGICATSASGHSGKADECRGFLPLGTKEGCRSYV
jgi:hypothetical protein